MNQRIWSPKLTHPELVGNLNAIHAQKACALTWRWQASQTFPDKSLLKCFSQSQGLFLWKADVKFQTSSWLGQV